MTIRRAKMAEYAGIERLYRKLIEALRGSEFKPQWEWGVYPTERMLKDAISEGTFWVAELNAETDSGKACELVGVMVLNHECAPEYVRANWRVEAGPDEVAVLHVLGVLPAYHGRGVAKQMIAHAAEICRRDGKKAIRLDVLEGNVPAARIYEAMGFEFVQDMKIYYEDTGVTDFLLYELVL